MPRLTTKSDKTDVQIGRLLYPESSRRQLPQTRASCPQARPCPYVSCRHNLYLDVTHGGTLEIPDHEPSEQDPEWSCVLDVCRRQPTYVEIASRLGISKQRVDQICQAGLGKMREAEGLDLFENSPGRARGLTVMKGDYG